MSWHASFLLTYGLFVYGPRFRRAWSNSEEETAVATCLFLKFSEQLTSARWRSFFLNCKLRSRRNFITAKGKIIQLRFVFQQYRKKADGFLFRCSFDFINAEIVYMKSKKNLLSRSGLQKYTYRFFFFLRKVIQFKMTKIFFSLSPVLS